MLLVGKENPVFKSLFQGQFLHSCLSQTHRTSLKSSWNTLSKISWQLGCKLQRGEENKDAPLLSFFLYGLPHLAPCWGWWLSPSSSRDFVLLSGGLTLASRQSPIQLCHSFQQAVWTYLLFCSLWDIPCIRFGNTVALSMCWRGTSALSPGPSGSPHCVELLIPSHKANELTVHPVCRSHNLK